MCYQIPGSITKDGTPILGGIDIDQEDSDFAAKIYPKVTAGRQTLAPTHRLGLIDLESPFGWRSDFPPK
jgi:hypothetical protein